METYKQQPARACKELNCEGCDISGKLICYAQPTDLVDFGILVVGWFVPFFAGMIRGRYWLGLGLWVVLAVAFFGYVEAFVLCRHCPAYAEEGKTLRCHANWGLPKFPEYEPRPLTWWEGAIFLGYGIGLFLYPIPFFASSGQWLLLVWVALTVVSAAWTVYRTQCNRCFNLGCPVNHVPDDVRRRFLVHYPEYGDAFRAEEGFQAPAEEELDPIQELRDQIASSGKAKQ